MHPNFTGHCAEHLGSEHIQAIGVHQRRHRVDQRKKINKPPTKINKPPHFDATATAAPPMHPTVTMAPSQQQFLLTAPKRSLFRRALLLASAGLSRSCEAALAGEAAKRTGRTSVHRGEDADAEVEVGEADPLDVANSGKRSVDTGNVNHDGKPKTTPGNCQSIHPVHHVRTHKALALAASNATLPIDITDVACKFQAPEPTQCSVSSVSPSVFMFQSSEQMIARVCNRSRRCTTCRKNCGASSIPRPLQVTDQAGNLEL